MKLYIINICVVITFCLTAFTSCSTDAEGTIYKMNGDEFAFASSQMNVEVMAENNGIIKVPVYRSNKNTEASTNISLDEATIAEGIFSLSNSTVTFAKGESVGYAELKFGSIDNLGATNKYEMVLTINNEAQLSPSQLGQIKVSAQRKLTWESFGTGVYFSEIFGDSWSQPIEKAAEGNIYRLPSCIVEGYPLVFSLSDDGQTLTGWSDQESGYEHPTYGMVYFRAVGMNRNGNTLSFHIYGLVALEGGWGKLAEGIEVLEMPEK